MAEGVVPAPHKERGWTQRVLKSGEWAAWMRAYLVKYGGYGWDELDGIGGHSCKHTYLAWCYKVGVGPSIVKPLGYRVEIGDRTSAEYSRGNVTLRAPPAEAPQSFASLRGRYSRTTWSAR